MDLSLKEIDQKAEEGGYIDSFFRNIIHNGIKFLISGLWFKDEYPHINYIYMDWEFRNKLIADNPLFDRDEVFNMIAQIEFNTATELNAIIEEDYYGFKNNYCLTTINN